VAVAEVGSGRGQVETAREQLALLAHVGHCVLRELRERAIDLGALFLEALLELLHGELSARRQHAAVSPHLPTLDHEVLSVSQLLEERGGGRLDEPHPGSRQHQRSRVRIAPGRERRDVDHGAHAGRRQVLGGDAVEVRVVDHGEVAGLEALHEVLGPAVELGGPLYGRRARRLGLSAAAEEGAPPRSRSH
jgi:hypothetical protein